MGTNARQPSPQEVDRLARAGAIVAVRDQVVPEHRSTEQLHRRVLLRRWQRGETFGMWRLRDHPALSQVGSLLDPAAEGHAAALEPRIELRNGVGAIVGMKQCVCQGVGMIDVDRPAHHAGDRMGRRQLLERVAKLSQVRVRGSDPEQATVLLHHVDAGPPVQRVHHQVHRPLRTQDIAKGTQADVGIGQMVKHSGADHLVERASELADVLNRRAGEARDSPVDTSAGARACNAGSCR